MPQSCFVHSAFSYSISQIPWTVESTATAVEPETLYNTIGCLYSVEWNGGMEWWNGTVEWNSGMEWWNSGMTTPIDRVL